MSQFIYLFRASAEEHGEAMGTPEAAQQSMEAWLGWVRGLESKGHLKDPGQPIATGGAVVRGKDKVVTDGPYVETKEWLGGVVVLALKDTNHAIELLSTHPGLRFGVSIEFRPTDDELNARWETRHHRIQKASR